MKRPWMPLYVNDFLADTLDLRADETGVYFVMLLICWRRKDAALPNDMKWLKRSLSAQISDMHGNRFNRIVPKILNRFFVLDTDGMWRQPRLVYEREKAEKFCETQRENIQKRWSKTRQINNLEHTNVIPARARQSQSHIESTSTVSEDTAKKPITVGVVSPELAAILNRKGW
jgi:uncharacterized protein YdaU (DUF1376 family)